MRVTDVILTQEQILNGDADASVLLTGVREGFLYENGQITSKIDHYKYDVVIPTRKYEKLTVKISGRAILTNDMIELEGGVISVRLKGLTGKFYRTAGGEYALSATAEGVEIVS